MAPVLKGRRVTLRPPIDTDVEVRLALGRDPDIHRMYGGSRSNLRLLTSEGAKTWFAWVQAHPCAWIIDRAGLIGDIRLDNINGQDCRASLAIGIADPAAIGQGLGTEAIGLVAAHAFGPMALHRLTVRVLAFNERAIRAYQKCGFRVEGRERESACIDGDWHDDIIMGLLASEALPATQARSTDPNPAAGLSQ
jgi:RimJ/RimL family protein N-acetyltransferase